MLLLGLLRCAVAIGAVACLAARAAAGCLSGADGCRVSLRCCGGRGPPLGPCVTVLRTYAVLLLGLRGAACCFPSAAPVCGGCLPLLPASVDLACVLPLCGVVDLRC